MPLFRRREATAGTPAETAETITEAGYAGDLIRVVAAMRSANPDIRRAAVDGLARYREPEALTAVLAAVRDPDRRVREGVVGALAAWPGDHGKVGALLDMAMHDADWGVRRRAVETVAASDTGGVDIVGPLIGILRVDYGATPPDGGSRDAAYVRMAAARALGLHGDPRAVNPLIDALRDDEVVSSAAAEALIALDSDRAVDPLVGALRDPKNHPVSREVIQHVVKFLRPRGDRRVKDALLAGYADSGSTSSCYTSALVDLADGDEAVVAALIAELERARSPEAAAHGLARLGDPRAIGPLAAAFRKNFAASSALGQLAAALVSFGEPGIKAMLEALPEEGWAHSMRSQAAAALEKIGDPRAAVALVPDPAERARLADMRARYQSADYAGATVAQLTQMLTEQFAWMGQNDHRYGEAQAEFDVREVQIAAIGEELNRRGGEQLMRTVHGQIQRGWQRHLERSWSGIGGWWG